MEETISSDAIAPSDITRPIKAERKLLRKAYKCMRPQYNGTKAALVERFEGVAMKVEDKVDDLAHKFVIEGQAAPAASTAATSVRKRQSACNAY